MKKRFFSIVLFVFLVPTLVFAGGSKDKSKDLTPTAEEKAKGWRFFEPIGFRLQRPAFFDSYDDLIWADSDYFNYTEDETSPIFHGYLYAYAHKQGLENYIALNNDDSLSYDEYYDMLYNEVIPSFKSLYGLIVLRTPLVGKTPLSEITGYKNNQVISKNHTYTQVFAYNDFDFSGLDAEDKEIYTEMSKQVSKVKSTIKCVDPFLPEWHLLAIKNLQFDTVDLNGNRVTSDIFKNYDVTMINIWATWCGPCKAELPELQKVYEKYKTRNCNVIGLTTDVELEEQDALPTAIDLLKKAGCKYQALQTNSDFDPVLKGVIGIPTTIFVDKNGTIIAESAADLIIGSRDYEEFAEAFDKALRMVNK